MTVDTTLLAAKRIATATGRTTPEAMKLILYTRRGFCGELGEIVPAVRSLGAEDLRNGRAADVVNSHLAGVVVDGNTAS